MSSCKDYQRQLSLLSVQAPDESEIAAVLDHLKHCTLCRAYSERLQNVVSLYQDDAERSIVVAAAPMVLPTRPKQALFTWWHAATATAAVLILTAVIFLPREDSSQPASEAPVAASNASSVLSIADSRSLLNQDLEALLDLPKQHNRSEFVFSVATRYEGP